MNIEEEVEKRKKRAIDLALHIFIESFYNQLQFYVSHLLEDEYIKKIEELAGIVQERDAIKFLYRNNEYLITKEKGGVYTHEFDDATYDKDIYALFLSAKRVFEIAFVYRYEDYEKKLAWHSIDVFIEGEWIKNLKSLLKEIMPINDTLKRIANEEHKEAYEKKLGTGTELELFSIVLSHER